NGSPMTREARRRGGRAGTSSRHHEGGRRALPPGPMSLAIGGPMGVASGSFGSAFERTCWAQRGRSDTVRPTVLPWCMGAEARRILQEALHLPDEERAEVAATLLESLDGPADPGAEQAWREEIARRLEQVRRGEAVLVPWEDVKRQLRARSGRGHG